MGPVSAIVPISVPRPSLYSAAIKSFDEGLDNLSHFVFLGFFVGVFTGVGPGAVTLLVLVS